MTHQIRRDAYRWWLTAMLVALPLQLWWRSDVAASLSTDPFLGLLLHLSGLFASGVTGGLVASWWMVRVSEALADGGACGGRKRPG